MVSCTLIMIWTCGISFQWGISLLYLFNTLWAQKWNGCTFVASSECILHLCKIEEFLFRKLQIQSSKLNWLPELHFTTICFRHVSWILHVMWQCCICPVIHCRRIVQIDKWAENCYLCRQKWKKAGQIREDFVWVKWSWRRISFHARNVGCRKLVDVKTEICIAKARCCWRQPQQIKYCN